MKTFHEIMTGLNRPTRFFFVRHGESEGNARGVMQGRMDLPLTGLGRDQAQSTGRWFAESGVCPGNSVRVFTSPLRRAAETAGIIAGCCGAPQPTPLPTLNELHTGKFTGLSFPEIESAFPAEYADFIVESWETVPDAEPVVSLAERALSAWQTLVDAANAGDPAALTDGKTPGEPIPVIAVTHGGLLQWVLKTSLGAEQSPNPTWMPLILASNCSVFQLDARPVRSPDRDGNTRRWYYAQWSRMNVTPGEPSSAGSVAREQFHTDRLKYAQP